MKERHPFSHYIAHRGLHDRVDVDENSYEAFQIASDKGYGIECDVHLTKDGKVVVHHDETTARLMDQDLEIIESNFEDLAKLKHKNSVHPMLLLSDLLDLVNGAVPLLVEIKFSERGRELDYAVSEILKEYKGEVAVQSFDPFSCQWFKNNNPEMKRGLLIGNFDDVELNFIKRFALKNFFFVPLVSPDFIGLEWLRGDELIVRLLRERCKMGFVAWTVRTEESYQFCKRYFDNIIFENESLLEKK